MTRPGVWEDCAKINLQKGKEYFRDLKASKIWLKYGTPEKMEGKGDPDIATVSKPKDLKVTLKIIK